MSFVRGYKIWLPLASLFLFFLIAEIICRVVGSKEKVDTGFKFYVRNLDNDVEYAFMREDHFLLWSPEPNYDDGEISINSDGFRDKEYKAEKARNTFRILCLGDSSTFGFGITSLSHTYHELLEDELNHQYGKNVIYEVINAGVTGYTSYQGLNLFKYKGAKYDPDIVTFYFGINDPIKRFYLNDAQIVNNKVPSTMKIMNNNFMLKFASYRFLHNIISKLMDIVLHTNVPRVPVEDYKENIRKLNQLCKKNGAKFLIVSYSSDWLYPTYQSRSMVKVLKKNGLDVSFCEIEANCGHDAFLLPNEKLSALMTGFLVKSGE